MLVIPAPLGAPVVILLFYFIIFLNYLAYVLVVYDDRGQENEIRVIIIHVRYNATHMRCGSVLIALV